MEKQAYDKRITNTAEPDGLIVESFGTEGAYNYYGVLAYNIKFDEKKKYCSGNLGADTQISSKQSKETSGGIIVIANGTETVDDCDYKKVSSAIEELEENAQKKLAASWSIGRYLKNLSYSHKENELFDENSYCVELTGIRKETLLDFAKKLCIILGKDALVKPYEDTEIIFIDHPDRR